MKDYSNLYYLDLYIIQKRFDLAFESMQRGDRKDSIQDLKATITEINRLITKLEGEEDDN